LDPIGEHNLLNRRETLGGGIALSCGAHQRARGHQRSRISEILNLLNAQEHLRSGDAGERAVEIYLADALEAAGFALESQRVECPRFDIAHADISFERERIPLVLAPFRDQTLHINATTRLAPWRSGADTNHLAGAVAVIDLPYARHSQLITQFSNEAIQRAVQGDPLAILLITHGPTGETIQLNVPIAQCDLPAVPILLLGPKPARALTSAIASLSDCRLVIEASRNVTHTANLIGSIQRAGRTIVFSTPRTGWTAAVAERGPGLAAFRELAVWAPGALRNFNLAFVCTAAHEYDNAGSRRYLETLAPRASDVALWVHLGAGFAARDFHELGDYRLLPLPSTDPQRFLVGSTQHLERLQNAFERLPGLERPYPATAGAAGELSELIAHGYTSLFGLFGAHRFHHVDADRLDKTDPDWIAACINAIKRATLSIVRAPR